MHIELSEKTPLRIDDGLRSLVPPLADDEYQTLEQSILAEGIRDSLVVWGGIIVDGHNRYEIAQKYGLPYETLEMGFKDRTEAMVWMIDNQRGRRNLTKQAWLDLGFKRAELLKPLAEANLHRSPGRKGSQESDKDLPPVETVDTLQEAADYAGVSRDTAAKYKRVMSDAPDELKEKVRTGETSINRAYREIKKPAHEPEDDYVLDEWDGPDDVENDESSGDEFSSQEYQTTVESAVRDINGYIDVVVKELPDMDHQHAVVTEVLKHVRSLAIEYNRRTA